MKRQLFGALTAVVLGVVPCAAEVPVYLDATKPIEERVEDALGRMTLEEKVKMLHAQSKFSSAGVPRLGIPEVWTDDGPHGLRPEVIWDEWNQAGWTNDSCTAFPALTCLAATWNPDMALLYGRSIGEEARYRRKDILLGPGVNICRTPLNGRNFEYMGEDPYLASVMVVPYIKGVQSNNVAACVKHFALNNNEHARTRTDVHVSDRALREIYLPAFEAAVKEGDVWAVMGAYNLYNNAWCCENPRLIREILKGEWGFDGVAISDWGGVHTTDAVLDGGLDMEFGTGTNGTTTDMNAYDTYRMANPYLDRLRDGSRSEAELDEHVRRVLRLVFRTNMAPVHWHGRFTCPEHYEAARTIGADGIVLLKNEGGLLPIDPAKTRKVLVVGENAVKMMTVGGGSSSLKVQKEVSPLDGLRDALAGKADVEWQRGYIGVGPTVANKVASADVDILKEERDSMTMVADALRAAAEADMVVFVGGLNKTKNQDCEGADRKELGLPYGQPALIEALASANPNIVVVNVSGSPVAMPWADKVPAIVQAWYLGSEAGNAIADVLTGKVNPSGKLPFTFPAAIDDTPVAGSERRYPGIQRDNSRIFDQYYDEDILVGYRWYDTKKIAPQWPFGHGISYTTFAYSNPEVSSKEMAADGSVEVSVDVTNTGSVPGAEVVQLYVSAPKSKILRPAKELKGFDKVHLNPGETKRVKFRLTPAELAYFDEQRADWTTMPGRYKAHIAASAADIRHSVSFDLKK